MSHSHSRKRLHLPFYQPGLQPMDPCRNDQDRAPIKDEFKKCKEDGSEGRGALQHGRLADNAALYGPDVRQASEQAAHQAECKDGIRLKPDRQRPQAKGNCACHHKGDPWDPGAAPGGEYIRIHRFPEAADRPGPDAIPDQGRGDDQ